ncbi:hypothetical protein WMY93_005795 [Mugilogobius chulae]|uniref:G-protein coupled receptors family 1 profile domain-containing protein n=1 Tax=Mugilogobius chulae TaxID=88201 RepID=A0AAW0PHS6_9GOBI
MFHTGPWTIKLSQEQWFVRQGLIDTSLTASVMNLLAVAVERHQTIFSMQLHSEMSIRRVVVIILAIWLVSIVMGLVPIMGWHCLCDLENCSTMAPLYHRHYLVFWAVLNSSPSSSCWPSTLASSSTETVENLMKTVSLILGCFVLCWTPGLVLLLLDGLGCEACKVLRYEKYCLVLAECNSFVNPIIYSFRDADMRRTFRELMCCLCRRRRDAKDHPNASRVRFNTLDHENQEERVNGTPLVQPSGGDPSQPSRRWS